MKKYIIWASVSVLLLLGLFSSCDKVSNPYPAKNVNVGDTSTCPTPSFVPITSHTKKILIEDFTGHTCPNCPKAARRLNIIDTTYPGRIIGLGLHVSSFALPSPGYNGSPQTAYLNDYRTSVGDIYDAFFGPSAQGLPKGMINRKDYNAVTKTHLKSYADWQTYVASIINEPSVVDLQMHIDYNSSSRKICLGVKDSFLTTLSGDYKLCALLVQDSIIDWQDNIGVSQPDYLHRHVLRDAITPTGAWGENLIATSVVAGSTHLRKYAYTVPASYNGIPCDIEQCHIIAFIYNTATYEIIQSEEIKVLE
jgi:hypothetical protein